MSDKKPARNVEKLIAKAKAPKIKPSKEVTLPQRFTRRTTKKKPFNVIALIADAMARKKGS